MKQRTFRGKNARIYYNGKEIEFTGSWELTGRIPWYKVPLIMIANIQKKIRRHILYLNTELIDAKALRGLTPSSTLLYDLLSLGVAVTVFKIELWKTFLPKQETP